MSAERQRHQGETPRRPVRDIGDAIAEVSKGEATPSRKLLREDLTAIAESRSVCEACGKLFDPWRKWRDRLIATGKCHECWSASIKRPAKPSAPQSSVEVEQVVEQTPSATPARQTGWADVLPEPRYLVRADGTRELNPAAATLAVDAGLPSLGPAILDCPLDGPEDDDELTFGDLPGSRMVFELLDLLPTNGRWAPRRREKWFAALRAALDLLIDEQEAE